MHREHPHTEQNIQEARLNSLSAIKVIIRENEETIFPAEREILTVIYQGLGFGKRLSVSKICDSVSSLTGLLGAGEDNVNDKLYLMT